MESQDATSRVRPRPLVGGFVGGPSRSSCQWTEPPDGEGAKIAVPEPIPAPWALPRRLPPTTSL